MNGVGSEHRIHRVVFDLRFSDEATAFGSRGTLLDVFQSSLLPALEDAFESVGTRDHVHRVDRIVVELGRLDAERLDGPALGGATRRALVAAFEARRGNVETEAVARSLETALLEFLRTGSIAWPLGDFGLDELEAAVRTASRSDAASFAARLRPVLRERAARFRVVHQLGRPFLEWVVAALLPRAGRRAVILVPIELDGWDPGEADELLLEAAVELPPSSTAVAVARELRERARARSPRPRAGSERSAGSPGRPRRPAAPNRPGVREVAGGTAPGDEERAETRPTRHSGIVILHPFLERFYRRLDLLGEDGGFRSAADRVRAIHLLYHLATGDDSPAEPETLLFKVLCGHPLEAPLVRDLPLTGRERDEAAALLTAAIDHWDRLGRTSIGGFREGFVEREGSLVREQRGWNLTVESRSIDVLLRSLPWGLSIVRLPWMDSALRVDWAG